jgi:hypothetical protein
VSDARSTDEIRPTLVPLRARELTPLEHSYLCVNWTRLLLRRASSANVVRSSAVQLALS